MDYSPLSLLSMDFPGKNIGVVDSSHWAGRETLLSMPASIQMNSTKEKHQICPSRSLLNVSLKQALMLCDPCVSLVNLPSCTWVTLVPSQGQCSRPYSHPVAFFFFIQKIKAIGRESVSFYQQYYQSTCILAVCCTFIRAWTAAVLVHPLLL